VATVVRMADEQVDAHTGVVAMDSRQAKEVVDRAQGRMVMAERGAEYEAAFAEYREAKKEYHDILFAEFLGD
jgi:hypothetical protein